MTDNARVLPPATLDRQELHQPLLVADVRVPDDETALALIRREVAALPTSGAGYYRHGADPLEPHHPPGELAALLPDDHRHTYDATELLARLVDQSLFWECLPERGREMIVGVGRVNGLYLGFVANRQGLIDDPEHHGAKKPAGILYQEGIAKVAAFSRACDADGIPLVWLQDISGFDIGGRVGGQPEGRDAEQMPRRRVRHHPSRRSGRLCVPPSTRCPWSRCEARMRRHFATPLVALEQEPGAECLPWSQGSSSHRWPA